MRLQIDVPNVQTGHTTLIYDTTKPEEAQLAKAQILAMMKAGFAIFVEEGGKTERITKFSGKIGKYLIGEQDASAASEGSTATAVADAPAAKVTATAPTSGGCVVK